MKENIIEVLSKIWSDILDEDIDLNVSTTAGDIEGWDSLNHVRLMVAVEQYFKIIISGSEMSELKNVGELIALIERKI